MLSSPKNPKIAAAARLKKRAFREQERLFLVEGAQGVREALHADGALRSCFVTDPLDELAILAREQGVEVHEISDDVMRKLTSTVTPQGIVGVAPFVDVAVDDLAPSGAVVLLHEVRDPGNAGTVLRSADAAGSGGVVCSTTSVDVYNPKTVRSSAGSIFHVPVVRGVDTVETVGHLRDEGFRVLAMDAEGTESLYAADLAGPVVFLFGNEAHGLPQDVVASADATMRIPHAGPAESLNLAAAATVCLFEWGRRRIARGATLETLVAAAAHDIRSPLTAMKGFGHALERRWDTVTQEQREMMLRGIVHDADRMDQIVRQLVDAARVASGALELFPELTDVGDLVATLAESQARDPEHPPIAWRGDPGPYFLDPARLRTTILGFIESLVWWGDDGPVEVGAERREGAVHVWAWRLAAGLDEAAAEALFVPRRPGSGSGSKLGLFVGRGVAEAQGGRAWGSTDDGKLTFHLELPLPV